VPEDDLEAGTMVEEPLDDARRRGCVRALEIAVDDQLSLPAHATDVVGGVDRS